MATTRDAELVSETRHGTVERRPYVGDSDVLVVDCRHGDYSRLFKGAGVRGGPVNTALEHRAEDALAEHYAAQHGEGN
jgi:hypothetical protein